MLRAKRTLPEPCGAPAEDEGVDPWAVGADGDGFEVGEGLELEVGVGDDAESGASSKVDTGAVFIHPCPSGHHVGLELETAGEMEVLESAGQGTVEGSHRA